MKTSARPLEGHVLERSSPCLMELQEVALGRATLSQELTPSRDEGRRDPKSSRVLVAQTDSKFTAGS